MVNLVKKYTTIFIIINIILYLFEYPFDYFFPGILRFSTANGIRTYSTQYIIKAIEYFLNIFLLIVMFKDMKKSNLLSYPILIISLFNNYLGIFFFLIYSIYSHLSTNKNETDETVYQNA